METPSGPKSGNYVNNRPRGTRRQTKVSPAATKSADSAVLSGPSGTPVNLASKIDSEPIIRDLILSLADLIPADAPDSAQHIKNFESRLRSGINSIVKETISACFIAAKEECQGIIDREQQSRRNLNICLRGLSESVDSNPNPHERELKLENAVIDVINQQVKPSFVLTPESIVRARRVGQFDVPNGSSTPKPRPIVITLAKHIVRMDILRKKKNLKGTGFMITEDLTHPRRQILLAAFAKFGPKNVWSSNGVIKWFANGKTFSASSMDQFIKAAPDAAPVDVPEGVIDV